MTFSRTLICLAFVAVSGLSLYAKTEIAKFQWERRYHGPKSGYSEQPSAVGMDAAGNVFVTGATNGQWGAEDFYTAKYAATDGSLLWEKWYSGNSADIPYALVTTPEGDVVVAGGSGGWFIIKYSGINGAVLWEQRLVLPTPYNGAARAIAIDSAGDLLVTGTLAQENFPGIFTLKCSGSTGAVLWQTPTTGTDDVSDNATSIVTDSEGNAIVSGRVGRLENGILKVEFYVAKYAGGDGEVLWEKKIADGGASTAGVDAAGNAIVAGYQGESAYTVKLAASNGGLFWERRYSGSLGVSSIASLKVDSEGDVYVVGSEAVTPAITSNLPGKHVQHVAKYSGKNGTVVWTTPLGTPNDAPSSAQAVVLDGDNNPVVAGSRADGNTRILVTKYRGTNGVRMWEESYGASSEFDFVANQRQLAVNPDGSVAVGVLSSSNDTISFLTLKYLTQELKAPVTGPALDVTANSARLTGTATSAGFAGQTMFFEMKGPNVTEARYASKELTGAEGSEVPHSGEVTGLRSHSTYIYRIVAVIDGKYVEGENVSFTTLNIAPEAKDDTFTRPATSNVLFFDVLANDSSEDGDALTLTSVSEPAYGTATIQNGIIQYRPTVDHEGVDSFTYTISDGFGGTSSATVRVGLSKTVAATKIGNDDVKVVVPGTEKLLSIARFGVPAIDGAGSSRFVAQVRGAMVIMNQQLGRVVSTWDAVPGVANAKFTSFRDPLLNEAGSMAFIARLQSKGARTGIFTDSFSGPEVRALAPMALTGTQAAGVNGARWSNFVSLGLLDSGAVPFVATLAHGAGGVTASSDLGLWFGTAEGTALLLREGQRLEVDGQERKVRTFAALTAVNDSPGHGRFASGAVPVRVAFTDGSSALVSAAPTGLELRVLTGESAPGVANATFTDFGTPALNESGAIAFAATLKAGSVRTSGIFADTHEGTLQNVALQKDAAPDVDGAQFGAFRDPVNNAEYSVAFLATLTGTGITQANSTGIWWNGSGDLHLVARTGDSAPGVQDAVFSKFISLALPDGELSGPVFVAEVTTSSTGKTKSRKTKSVGLWALDSTGTVRLIVKEGDVVSGKTITKLTSLSAVAGSPAQRRSYNDGSQIVYSATLDDGSQSIIKLPLP